ncbi:UbiA family prenyltransferase [Bermanella sp. WJH001]|uniref:UbiA family prenyltransferase n=1 Tax=Bermanella sp. WJH001 TaxID=3048005 RepID=UPI0024BED46A|nr:UbiA family prenyltransferase [Bermanella sp. WJH001]MDJ1538493.1 UbiA family prenyltransferase [Bermanella sp. WJH001]
MSTSASMNDALSSRIFAWMDERFPFKNALLFFILYLTSAVVARSTLDGEVQVSLVDVLACIVTWSLFLVIRIFDEHKDYALDVVNHPQRVLQRGLITLKHLKVLGVVAVFSQLLFSIYADGFSFGGATISYLIMFVYLCLMGAEFFCGEWLEKRLTLYAFSHMLIMPLIVFWLANLAVPNAVLNESLMVMMLLAFISGFCFEITRKTKGIEEERDTVDSYSRIFGTKGSAYIVMLLVSMMLLSQGALLFVLDVNYIGWLLIPLILMYGVAIRQVKRFIANSTIEGREKNEAAVAVNMLIGYLVIIIAVLVNNGMTGSWV